MPAYEQGGRIDLSNLAKREYVARVDRVIDHVIRDPAARHRLEDVAQIAGFSPYHFHRIFRSLVGETLAGFVRRVRLERAVQLLSHRPAMSFTDIALECGFASSSDFSRSFRHHYGVSPRRFDIRRHRTQMRARLQEKLAGVADIPSPEDEPSSALQVELRSIPRRRVAYRRVSDPYAGDAVVDAFRELFEWASARGLASGRWLGYQWDDPDVVPLEQCRYDVAVEIPISAELDIDVSEAIFEPMTVAEIAIDGPLEDELRAFDLLYTSWLPGSGYVPAHQPAFEAWQSEPFAGWPDAVDLRVQLPVVRASRTHASATVDG